MNQRGFVKNIIIIGLIILAGAVGYFIANQQMLSFKPVPKPIPVTKSECKSDSDCSSTQYKCEATQGIGATCPDDDPSCIPTSTITKGICKVKEGHGCRVNSDCLAGLLCHAGVCASPIGRQCSGPSDTSCPSGYECAQGCGWPVPRPDEPPPSYYCKLKGYIQICPICLAQNTLIDTPSGAIAIQDLEKGMDVWTIDSSGARISAKILETVRTPVPSTHRVIRLVLDDGRELFVSPGHSTADGRIMGNLLVGDTINNGSILSVEQVLYGEDLTYDILPSGETGFYWANDILVGSTL